MIHEKSLEIWSVAELNTVKFGEVFKERPENRDGGKCCSTFQVLHHG